jgi:hypothetical protein
LDIVVRGTIAVVIQRVANLRGGEYGLLARRVERVSAVQRALLTKSELT